MDQNGYVAEKKNGSGGCLGWVLLILTLGPVLGMILFLNLRDRARENSDQEARAAFRQTMESYGLAEDEYAIWNVMEMPSNRGSYLFEFTSHEKDYYAEVDVGPHAGSVAVFTTYYSRTLYEAIVEEVKKQIDQRGLFRKGTIEISLSPWGEDGIGFTELVGKGKPEDLELLPSYMTPDTFGYYVYRWKNDPDVKWRHQLCITITYYSKEENVSKEKLEDLFTMNGMNTSFTWRCDHYLATPEECTEKDIRATVRYAGGEMKYEKFD